MERYNGAPGGPHDKTPGAIRATVSMRIEDLEPHPYSGVERWIDPDDWRDHAPEATGVVHFYVVLLRNGDIDMGWALDAADMREAPDVYAEQRHRMERLGVEKRQEPKDDLPPPQVQILDLETLGDLVCATVTNTELREAAEAAAGE